MTLRAAGADAGRKIEPPWAVAAFVAGYFLLGLLTLTPEHRWGDDWAQYVLHARNLATGLPYPDIGYVFNPDYASVGPPTYPPGLPLLLTPMVALVGIDIVAMKVVGLACVALTLPFALKVMQPVTGRGAALFGIALLAVHPVVWQQRQVIQSEAPYILFSLLALWWGARPLDDAAPRHRAALAGVVLGILVYATCISRAVGIALLPALLVFGWAQRKHVAWFLGLALSFALLLGLQSILLVEPPTYRSELRAPSVGMVSAKPWGYLIALADLFPLPLGLAPVGAAAIIVVSLAGAWLAVAGSFGLPRADSLRALAARVPLPLWYLGAYLAALFFASVFSDSRLLLPLLPIVLPLAVLGVRGIATRLALPRGVLAAGALLAMAYLAALHTIGRPEQMATCADCREMFAFVRARTDRDSVIVFSKPRAMALLADRRSWTPSWRYDVDELDARLSRLGARFVVEGLPGTEFWQRFPPSAALHARLRRSDAEVVFRNASFIVYRLGVTRAPA